MDDLIQILIQVEYWCPKCELFCPQSVCQNCGQVTVTRAEVVAPPEISCTEMGRVLSGELAEAESQMKAHFKDQQYHYWEGVCNGIETCIDALQRMEKHSTAALQPLFSD